MSPRDTETPPPEGKGLDEIRAALREWDEMGAVEQLREDATYWVETVRSLVAPRASSPDAGARKASK